MEVFTPQVLTLINTVFGTLGLGLIAYNTYLTRRTELNTNSMKDALIVSTDKLSRAQGVVEGQAQERNEVAARKKKDIV